MPIVSSLAATASSRFWRDERINDDRFHVDRAAGLALIADACGSKYGGYWAPFGIDPGLAALVDAFPRVGLAAAMEAAHAVMLEGSRRYEAQRAGRTGLEVARRVADALRPPAWSTYDSFGHYHGSVTACAVSPAGVVIAQVGECHAYALRDGAIRLLARDHTLPSVLETSGASAEEVEAAREHSRVVVSFLGIEKLQMNVVEVAPPSPSRIALVSDGLWRCDGAVEKAFRAQTHAELLTLLEQCAEATGDDATAVLLDVTSERAEHDGS